MLAIERALIVFIILSIVSLLADITYEGARSISGPYLELLGASLIIAGGVSVGELLSYAFRFIGGIVAFRLASSLAYWSLLILGYIINLVAVPLLAFAGSWEVAFALYMVERIGKGFRVPIRDTIIAEVSTGVGRGKAFAIHEFLDQIGALVGPLIVAYTITSTGGSYSMALLILGIPAMLSIVALFTASAMYPKIRSASRIEGGGARILPRGFYLACLAVGLAMFSFIHWGQASYIAFSLGWKNVALLYALAMAIDGLVSIPLGVAYDSLGPRILLVIPIATLLSTIALSHGNILAFILLWGIAMGALEVLPKAIVAELVDERARSLAYSILFLSMGLGWTLGNITLAYLTLESTLSLILVLVASLASMAIILRLR